MVPVIGVGVGGWVHTTIAMGAGGPSEFKKSHDNSVS